MEDSNRTDIRAAQSSGKDAELKEYEKNSLIVRAALAAGTMILSGLAGYLTGRVRKGR